MKIFVILGNYFNKRACDENFCNILGFSGYGSLKMYGLYLKHVKSLKNNGETRWEIHNKL